MTGTGITGKGGQSWPENGKECHDFKCLFLANDGGRPGCAGSSGNREARTSVRVDDGWLKCDREGITEEKEKEKEREKEREGDGMGREREREC